MGLKKLLHMESHDKMNKNPKFPLGDQESESAHEPAREPVTDCVNESIHVPLYTFF